jgi:NAD(P)-dependent dehydrogenase (short-subunit alcohol dehydrogenase family)
MNTMNILITGASRGLGLELARTLATRGHRLVLAAREAGPLAQARLELERHTEVLALALDVSDEAERLVAAGLERFGHIDALVNNASAIGSSPMPSLETLPWQELERVLRVNVTAPMHLAQLVLPGMRAQGRGVIVNVTSDAALQPYAGWGAYGASKAALEQMSHILAAEVEGSGVRVYWVDPGDMNTRMHAEAEPGVDLSALPHPRAVAPFFVRLLEDATIGSGRLRASVEVAVS